MNVSNATPAITSLYPTSTQSNDATAIPPPPDGEGRHGPPRHGAPMMDAVSQALQSMGLSLPAPPASSTSATSAADTSSTATSSGSAVGSDMRTFMHDLFEAMKSDASATTADTPSSSSSSNGSGDPAGGFSAALASLISKVGSGSTPSALQDSFAKLVSDLQATGSSAGANDGSATSKTGAATLQTFLTNLQQDVGYGASQRSRSVGSLLSSTA